MEFLVVRRIRYDRPIKVTQAQHNFLSQRYAGAIAHRKDENGQYWIKIWLMMKEIKQIL